MTEETFRESLLAAEPPENMSPILQALWWAEKCQWDRAHNIAQDIHSKAGSLIHAHLHREEGDLGNASYWYNRANEPVAATSLEDERSSLIKRFL